ncbi:MAG: DUF4175 family protein, partial [Balneolaceae bacterium]
MADFNRTENKLNEILSLLKKAYKKLNRWRIFNLFNVAAGTFLTGLMLFVLFEMRFYFSATIKTTFLFLLLLLTVTVTLRLYKTGTIRSFKQFIELFLLQNGFKNVLSAIDLHLDPDQKKSRFYQAAITSNLIQVEPDQIERKLNDVLYKTNESKIFRAGLLLLTISVLFTAYVSISLPSESLRTLTFWNSTTQPNPYFYTVSPGDSTIEHGTSVAFDIRFSDQLYPENSILEFKTDVEEEFRQRPMVPVESGHFQSPDIDLNNDITYRLLMDGFYSPTYRIDVQQQPRFEQLTAVITPPGYTELSETELEYPFTNINLYQGSQLEITGSANKDLQEALIFTNREDSVQMERLNGSSDQFYSILHPDQSDTLRFKLKDTDGLQNSHPFRIIMNVRNDQYPVIVIQEPTGTVMKNNPQALDIFYQASDDFGLTRAQLVWEHQRAFVDQPETGTIALQRPLNGRNAQYSWELSDFDLRPRDQLTFRIRVWDNDEISGFKRSESQSVTLQIPSLAEAFDELDSRERDVQGELDQISENFDRMGDEYQEFLERLMQNPDAGYEEQQVLEDIRDRQQMIDEEVKQMNEKFEELRSELEQNDRISDETRQAYQELQQLMQELDDPALQEAMAELQQALESMNQQDLERAMENVSFNENLYRERIERTAELFKRLKMNSDLDKLASQYEDMAERITQHQDQDQEESMDLLNRELENIQDDLDSVSEQLDQIDRTPPARTGEQLRQIKEEGQQKLEQIRDQMDELMQETEQGLQDGESTPTDDMKDSQNQIAEQMMSEAERFRSSIQQMSGQQIQVNIVALQRALYTLLELSNIQEYLTQTSGETRNRSQGFVDLARQQKNVSDQFSLVADTLFQISAELPGIPNQVNRKKVEVERTLSSSLDNMVERDQRGSLIASRESLGGINDLTSMIASLIDQIMNQQNSGSGGSGGMTMQQMIEQLQNMSQDQQALNQELQNLINDAQGNRLNQDQSERLDQIARQQNEIRRQLQELQQRGALNQGDRALSDLQRMLEEMEDSINDMRGGITDPIMVQRQQNILSRMLSAEQSLQQRGEDEEREGTAATDYERILPPDMTLQELEQEIRARMQDPNYT